MVRKSVNTSLWGKWTIYSHVVWLAAKWQHLIAIAMTITITITGGIASDDDGDDDDDVVCSSLLLLLTEAKLKRGRQ